MPPMIESLLLAYVCAEADVAEVVAPRPVGEQYAALRHK
jgi:hypothetical protein